MKINHNLTIHPHPLLRAGFVLLALLCFVMSAAVMSATAAPIERSSPRLQAGDVILVPLNCYVCNAIEKETGVPYSHSVVVGQTTDNLRDVFVYEAWGTTKKTPLDEIQKRAQKNEPLYLIRPKEFTAGKSPTEAELSHVFANFFADTAFDDEFLWNNFDDKNREKLYCSEFVVKFLNHFLQSPQEPAPMSFTKQLVFWEKYFKQFNISIPENEPGASPATLYFSPRFEHLGILKIATD